MLKCIVMLVVLTGSFWFVLDTSHAQEITETPLPTPTPLPGVILFEQAQVFFPEAIHFRAELAIRRDDLATSTLRLYQPDGIEERISIDPEIHVTAETLDTILLEVVIPITDEMRIFEPVTYQWDIEAEGEESSIALGEFDLQPPVPGQWQHVSEAPLKFSWYDPNLGVHILRDDLIRVYEKLKADTWQEPTFNYVIYEPEYHFCEEGHLPGAEQYQCRIRDIREFYAAAGKSMIQRRTNEFDPLENRLITEMVSAFYEPLWEGEVPAWFTSGLAQFYRLFGGGFELAIVQQAAQQEQLLPLEPEPPDDAEHQLWEAQNEMIMRYLAEEYGATAPVELALLLDEEPDFEAAFRELTGLSVEAFYRQWQPWILTHDAMRAIAWNPYMQTTPTSTPTRTPTPIPPTRTPTMTPTITLTPTSTSLVEREPSPFRPSPTPPTLTRRTTPTNTPLPPGSLPTLALPTATITPLPQAPANSDNGEDESSGLPCGASAVVIPVMGVLLFNKRRILRL